MKRISAALALFVAMQAAGAQADMQLFISSGTIPPHQAQEAAGRLSQAMGETVVAVMEEDEGRSFSQAMMDGCAPQLAIVYAGEIHPWAQEGMLTPLSGTDDAQGCALKIYAQERWIAVRTQRFAQAGMTYLLDTRTYPAWYPMQVLQALDELALSGDAGIDVWPPEAHASLWLEALLQGVSGEWLPPDADSAMQADMRMMESALTWLSDMTHAGLIGAAPDRKTALARFIAGETAIFPDWSQADSMTYAQEIDSGEIALLPYPNASGLPLRAARQVVLCAPRTGNGVTTAQAAALSGWEPADDTAQELTTLESVRDGATLRALLCRAAEEILCAQADAQTAAARIDRALKTARMTR